MINSSAFDYINVLDKAADASWTRESLITNNIANSDTPGYKRQDLDFESLLKQQMGRTKGVSFNDKIVDLNTKMKDLNPIIYKDHAGYSYRLDGNNVDIDTENVELASEQIKYQALTGSIDSQFKRMNSVLR